MISLSMLLDLVRGTSTLDDCFRGCPPPPEWRCAYPDRAHVSLLPYHVPVARIPCRTAPSSFPGPLPGAQSPESTEELLEDTPLTLLAWNVDGIYMYGCTEHTLLCEASQVVGQEPRMKREPKGHTGSWRSPRILNINVLVDIHIFVKIIKNVF